MTSPFKVMLFGHEISISISSILITAIVLFVTSKILKFIHGLRAVNYVPGVRVPFDPFDFPGVVIPPSWWNPGMLFLWNSRKTLYKRYGNDTVSLVPFLAGVPTIYTSNLDVVRQFVAGGKNSDYWKPENNSRALALWGENLFTTDGDDWRKHRRVIGPAFTNELYEMVWAQTMNIYKEMVAVEGWTDEKIVEVASVQRLTTRICRMTLLVIAKCGFGFPFSWEEPPKAAGAKMSFQEALHIVSTNMGLAVFVPKWMSWLPFKRLKEVREAYDELMNFMKAQVTEKQQFIRNQSTPDISDKKGSSEDIFTLLVNSNENEAGKFQLDDQELIGNVFIMLFAGHETTASTLAATLGFLALYPDIQEEVVEQILSVTSPNLDPVIKDYSKLNKVLATFYESIRLFPPGYLMIREAMRDTILKVPNPPGQPGSTSVPILKGTKIIADMVGLQYNSRYFEEPEKYKPSRWYGVSNESEVFTAFSVGPRTCIGRKFATIEAVCFLTMLLRDWRIEPIFLEGETRNEWRNRILDAKIVLTLGIEDVPLRFVRRSALP